MPKQQTLLPYLRRQVATLGRSLPSTASSTELLWVPEQLPHRGNGPLLGLLVYESQESQPGSIALEQDGKTLFVGNSEGEVRVWDLQTGKSPNRKTKAHTARIRCLSLSPDGAILASASQDSIISLWSTQGNTIKDLYHLSIPNDWQTDIQAKWSPNGEFFASHNGEEITIWSPSNGKKLYSHQNGNQAKTLEWSPDSKALIFAADKTIFFLNPRSGQVSKQWATPDEISALSWSLAGDMLATSNKNKFIYVWDPQSKKCMHQLKHDELKGVVPLPLFWSPHGRFLASFSKNVLVVWNLTTGACLWHKQITSNAPTLRHLAWSPNGEVLATLLHDRILIWSVETGEELASFPLADTKANLALPYLVWSSDGAFLVSSYDKYRIALWDTRPFLTQTSGIGPDKVVETEGKPLPRLLSYLPLALTQLHKLRIYPPLNLLHDVLQLLGGQKPAGLAALATPLSALIQLKWPPNARIGLAALVLRNYGADSEWIPPDISLTQLQQQMAYALSGAEIAAHPAPFSISQLQANTQVINENLINLLQMLGAESVARDPGLPLYLAAQLPRIQVNIPLNRRLLKLSHTLRSSGHAQQKLASGERTDLSIRGDLPHLLPSQLLLPPKVLNNRYLRNELLYRVYSGKEEPPLRPSLIILDVSPACFGPVEKITRQAAYILANTLYKAQKPVMLLAAGGQNSFFSIEKPADLLEIWIRRTLNPVQVGLTVQTAKALATTLQEDDVKPLVILLTHAYFGMEETSSPEVPHLRGLFVHHPHTSQRPAWSKHCERWETMDDNTFYRLPEALTYLLE